MRDKLEDFLDNWRDSYWRMDHPEVTMTVVTIITGILGLLFAVIQAKLVKKVSQ